MKGANATIIATMDHLAVANLLNGDPSKAAMVSEVNRQFLSSQVSSF